MGIREAIWMLRENGKSSRAKFCNRSSCKYLEMKAEMLISYPIFIIWCQTQMFSVNSQNKGIDVAVPVVLEGTV